MRCAFRLRRSGCLRARPSRTAAARASGTVISSSSSVGVLRLLLLLLLLRLALVLRRGSRCALRIQLSQQRRRRRIRVCRRSALPVRHAAAQQRLHSFPARMCRLGRNVQRAESQRALLACDIVRDEREQRFVAGVLHLRVQPQRAQQAQQRLQRAGGACLPPTARQRCQAAQRLARTRARVRHNRVVCGRLATRPGQRRGRRRGSTLAARHRHATKRRSRRQRRQRDAAVALHVRARRTRAQRARRRCDGARLIRCVTTQRCRVCQRCTAGDTHIGIRRPPTHGLRELPTRAQRLHARARAPALPAAPPRWQP